MGSFSYEALVSSDPQIKGWIYQLYSSIDILYPKFEILLDKRFVQLLIKPVSCKNVVQHLAIFYPNYYINNLISTCSTHIPLIWDHGALALTNTSSLAGAD